MTPEQMSDLRFAVTRFRSVPAADLAEALHEIEVLESRITTLMVQLQTSNKYQAGYEAGWQARDRQVEVAVTMRGYT